MTNGYLSQDKPHLARLQRIASAASSPATEAEMRGHLLTLADVEGIDPRRVHGLPADDVAAFLGLGPAAAGLPANAGAGGAYGRRDRAPDVHASG